MAPASFIDVRPATPEDASVLWSWARDYDTRSAFFTGGPRTWKDHVDWLSRVLIDPDSLVLIGYLEDLPIGTVRFHRTSETEWETSVVVAPSSRGLGLSAPLIGRGVEALRLYDPATRLVRAVVKSWNARSASAFKGVGFVPISQVRRSGSEVVVLQLDLA